MSQGSQDGGSNADGGEEEQGHFSMPNTVDKLQVRSQEFYVDNTYRGPDICVSKRVIVASPAIRDLPSGCKETV